MSETIPLCFGTRIVFADRWAGRVTGLEIDDAWEVLNILVTDGVIRSNTVKLPLDKASWTTNEVSFADATSTRAFAREVQPVAAPARPVTARTPLSVPGTRLAGALVDSVSRCARELLLTRSGRVYRVAVEQVTFSGKDIVIANRGESLERFYSDDSIEEALTHAIAESHAIPAGESRAVDISVRSGKVLIGGNVRTKRAREVLKAAAAVVPGAAEASIAVTDDVELEFNVARTLYNAGLSREAGIHPRSALGHVTLFGSVSTAEGAAEAVRTAGRVPGVRSVKDRMDVESRAGVTR